MLLVFAVLVLLYHRVHARRSSTWARCCWRRFGGAIALVTSPAIAVSMPVFIGILMLLGIVAKNSILLVDMAIEEMSKRRRTQFEAILEAGHKRVQPIVMTTVAMTAGMVPIALSLGGDGSVAGADGDYRGDWRADAFRRC
jgi:multidrug efflux pump subunit AcrB